MNAFLFDHIDEARRKTKNLPKGAPIDIYQDVDFSLNVFPKVTDISVAVQKDDSRRTSKGQSSPTPSVQTEGNRVHQLSRGG